MSGISKEELEKEIAKILAKANLKETSTKKVIQQLEKSLGVNLTDKKKLIDQLVMDYVNSKESEDEDEEDDDTEEEVKKPRAGKKATRSARAPAYEEDSDEEVKRPPKKKARRKGSDDEDWGKRGQKAEKTPKAKKAGGRGKGGGYTRAYKLSPALSDLMGADEMPRHEVVKRVWEIIKEKKLYDPNNKQFAICDDSLYKVIGTKRFRTFGMMKYLKNHFITD